MLQQFDTCSVSEARQRALLVEQQTRLGATQWSGNSRPRSTTIADDTNHLQGVIRLQHQWAHVTTAAPENLLRQ